ncbi:orotidine-5'-phosphate decarboxylase [Micropruina sp.]|uniref:orotidine-5'-phosphate decarboxylase n=1 Tax=Micropruina sp. TaxID=2737536 RepID=UPI0039E2D2F7
MTTYWQRLNERTAQRGALCVGIDPHPGLLKAWGLAVNASGVETLARRIVEVLGERIAVFKPQSAFFELHGSSGIAVLERVLADIAAAGALSLLDVKRGDIGSTMDAYAEAYLADGSPLAADAITVSPYLGFGALQPAFDRAHRYDRGVYVLARTSNPEGHQVQLALGEDHEGSVAQEVIDAARRTNSETGLGAIGLVVGGTHDDLGCDVSGFNGSILVPGIGFQGGRIDELPGIFGAAVDLTLPSVSRDVIAAGPDAGALNDRVNRLLAVSR